MRDCRSAGEAGVSSRVSFGTLRCEPLGMQSWIELPGAVAPGRIHQGHRLAEVDQQGHKETMKIGEKPNLPLFFHNFCIA